MLLVTGFAVGIGTLAITIGIVVLAGTLSAARTFARVERSRLDALLGVRMPRPAYRTPRGGRFAAPSRPAPTRDAGSTCCTESSRSGRGGDVPIVVTWFAAAVGGLGYVLWGWSLPRGGDNHSLAYHIGVGAAHRRHPSRRPASAPSPR